MVNDVVKTAPKKADFKNVDPNFLIAKRYGTADMAEIWGAEKTFSYSLFVQGKSIETLSRLYPGIVSPEDARELMKKASLEYIDPNRIREIEEKTGHDVIAINNAWGEVVERGAEHINKARTSADTTESAKALQLKRSLEVISDSLENLRDITLEKSMLWIDIPHMDCSHLYDALPTVAGRPFSHYAEMLQSDLNIIKYVYDKSIVGKWGDATGNHHSAEVLGIDGIGLQEKFCKNLGVAHMDASAQVPGREFITDVVYSLSRTSETLGNLAHYIRMGRSSDVGLFTFPRGQKGSSAMPHKDRMGGNPTTEEQTESLTSHMRGALLTSLSSCRMDYTRDLSGSASDRILLESSFKFSDHTIRRLADVVYKIELDKERSEERVLRSFGTVTSQQVMTYLTDPRKVDGPMSRKYAHDLTAKLATKAHDEKRPFINVILEDKEITGKLDEETLRKITNPLEYIGQSKEIIRTVFGKYHGKKTLV
ncbi:MAG: lyase family protein [Candidatus Aenigmarchaeota archaeon]|nr:lyase family protein [Candidatus Aenigmarchaeota archaeon]